MHRRHILKIKGAQIIAEGWGLAALVVIVVAFRILGG